MDTVPFLRLLLALTGVTGFPRANPTRMSMVVDTSLLLQLPVALPLAGMDFLILHNQRQSMVVDMGSTLQLPMALVG